MPTRKKLIDSLKYSGFAFLAILVATGLSFGLDALGISPEAILLVYLLPILAIAIVCPSYLYSMVSSVTILCLFNFCFTAPRYSFAIDNPELYISLAMDENVLLTFSESLVRSLAKAYGRKNVDLLVRYLEKEKGE